MLSPPAFNVRFCYVHYHACLVFIGISSKTDRYFIIKAIFMKEDDL